MGGLGGKLHDGGRSPSVPLEAVDAASSAIISVGYRWSDGQLLEHVSVQRISRAGLRAGSSHHQHPDSRQWWRSH